MTTRHHRAARVTAYTELIDYPCSKQELLQMANEQEFPDAVLDVLEDLPNKDYSCEEAVIDALEMTTRPQDEAGSATEPR